MTDTNRYHRQLDYLDPRKAADFPITFIGCGGIGSWAVLFAVKTGLRNIKVYDFDKVEEHNVSNQAFSPSQIGMYKVDAIKQTLDFFGEPDCLDVRKERFSIDSEKLSPIIVMGVDSIDSRKEIFELIKNDVNVRNVFDGRMGLTTMHIYNVNMLKPEHSERYEESLEGEFLQMPCTARATMSTAGIIGGKIVSRVVNYINDSNDTGFHEVYDTKTVSHMKGD